MKRNKKVVAECRGGWKVIPRGVQVPSDAPTKPFFMQGTRLLDKAMDILFLFLPRNQPQSVTELSERANLPRATVHRILAALQARGLVIRHGQDKLFQLGPTLVQLGTAARDGFHLRRWAAPALQSLADRTGETIHLAIRTSLTEGTFIEKVEGWQSVRLHTIIGAPVPLYTGATLKAILAHLPETEWDQVIAAGLKPSTERTIVDPDALRQHLREIRAQGFAASSEELYLGAGAVAAPVFGAEGEVIAGLGISGPISRFTPDRVIELAPLAREAAAQISFNP